MNQTINVQEIRDNLIKTDLGRVLLGNPDWNTIIDALTGEVLNVEGCTTDVNGKLESLSVS